MFINPAPKKVEKLLNSPQQNSANFQFPKSHCSQGYHLKRIGLIDNGNCRSCNEAPETGKHLMRKYIALKCQRLEFIAKCLKPE